MLNAFWYFSACKLENEIGLCGFKSMPEYIVTVSVAD